MDHYTHTTRPELAEASRLLPDMSSPAAGRLKNTGTHGADPVPSTCESGGKTVLPDGLLENGTSQFNSAEPGAGKEARHGVCGAKKAAGMHGKNRDTATKPSLGMAGFEHARPFGQGILSPIGTAFSGVRTKAVLACEAPGGIRLRQDVWKCAGLDTALPPILPPIEWVAGEIVNHVALECVPNRRDQ